MEVNKLYDYKNTFDECGMMFYYAGSVSQGIIEEIGEVIRQKIGLESSIGISEKVFGIFVEQLQNIMFYSEEKKRDDYLKKNFPVGSIILGRIKTHFYVLCGNKIDNKNLPELHDRLEKLKNMSKKEIAEFYKKELKKPSELSSAAGLGFIDMARKASSPLEYSFKKIDSDYSYFSLKVII